MTDTPLPSFESHAKLSPDTEEITITSGGGKQSRIEEACSELPPFAMLSLAQVLAQGAVKYGSLNWHNISVKSELDHALRHTFRFLLMENLQVPSAERVCELSHAACRLVMALDQFIREEADLTPKQED